ncbi:hypothetical protein [Nocardioides mesophilus]|uniref:Membrane protein YczE n=1 Tax=Nocardioides mesophilus TaxID=433659 RepID=A0A7G9RFK7_9ACTN|nr:hypothetical protein [Nocardioides mesophilus]QNN54382.1 hypothetical protein H9L09_08665 [Nocardioides mesophilus]
MTLRPTSRTPVAAVVQLVLGCLVLGLGVTLLLEAALGSDGYSTLVNGLTLSSGQPFWVLNAVVGVLLIAMAWVRGTVPGLGTLVQPLLVGFSVTAAMAAIPDTSSLGARVVELLLAFALLPLGVAAYLSSDTGAGPAEAAALAWDPPMPFRWSYSLVQGGGALVGWLLGAAVGPGTLLVIFLLGPAVDLLGRRVPLLRLAPR